MAVLRHRGWRFSSARSRPHPTPVSPLYVPKGVSPPASWLISTGDKHGTIEARRSRHESSHRKDSRRRVGASALAGDERDRRAFEHSKIWLRKTTASLASLLQAIKCTTTLTRHLSTVNAAPRAQYVYNTKPSSSPQQPTTTLPINHAQVRVTQKKDGRQEIETPAPRRADAGHRLVE